MREGQWGLVVRWDRVYLLLLELRAHLKQLSVWVLGLRLNRAEGHRVVLGRAAPLSLARGRCRAIETGLSLLVRRERLRALDLVLEEVERGESPRRTSHRT